MSDSEVFEQFRRFLPDYLSAGDRKKLLEGLRKFPDIDPFYIPESEHRLLQGDGWAGFVAVEPGETGEKRVSGLIVSNSCDIDETNRRHLPARVLFAPLVSMRAFELLLVESGLDGEAAADHARAIREQRVTHIFYLPDGPYGAGERIAMLDSIRPNNLHDFTSGEPARLFRLSMPGFYILLIKLSIHFSRVQEGVAR